MKMLFALTIIVLSTISTLATAQEPDRIIYQNQEKMLFSNPLEDYYADGRERPSFMIRPFVISSGNWRGYIATWKIDNGKLYLLKIDGWLCGGSTKKSCRQVRLSEIFPGKVKNGRVLADWFSGELRIPEGKQLQYVHAGYASTYERDVIFIVKKGQCSEAFVIDNTKDELPSELEATRRELARLKAAAEVRSAKITNEPPKRKPDTGILIVPGQDVFRYGAKRKDLESIIGDGEPSSRFEDVYFVEYPMAGVQVSYENVTDTVHVIFLYKNSERYEDFIVPLVKTDKGISWDSSEEDILNAYGKPLKDFSDESKSWRRLEYPGIDFLFQGGHLGRIGILGPDGN